MKSTVCTTEKFDVRPLKCPLTVLATRRYLKRLPSQTVAEVIFDDRASLAGFQQLCHDPGLKLIAFTNESGHYRLTILCGSGNSDHF